MNIGTFAAGIVLGLTLYFLLKSVKQLSVYSKVFCIIVVVLSLYCAKTYCKETTDIALIVVGCFACIIVAFIFDRYLVRTKFYMVLSSGMNNGSEYREEEDFMNTKLGKIVTVLVIFLVIYAIASTACIFRLNQKINSMVVITDELREEIGR